MIEPPEDLAPLLGPVPPVAPDPVRREHTLRATTNALRRGRTVRGGVLVFGAAVLFLAGGVAGWLAKPTPAVVELPAPPASVPAAESARPVEVEPPTAERLELRAELADDPADAARLYREAGDRFLTARDYENAARCYRRHLGVADAEALKVSASDSWMLHTMKRPVR
jgi:hypothetical protein